MNKTTSPPASQLAVTCPIGLTSGRTEPEDTRITDQEIITAFEKLNRLHFYSGEAVAQFAAIGAIRQIIFRPGSNIIVAYERDAREARDAVKLLGDPKATALMDEVVNLIQWMIQRALSQPELMEWYKWNGLTGEEHIAVVIDKVTQYLTTLCR